MTKDEYGPDQRTVAFFDSIAKDYHSLYDETTPGGYAFVLRRQRILELFDKPGGHVLDVGCGSGVMVEALLAQNCIFWGIDPSVKMIEQGQQNFGTRPNVHFAVGSAEKIEFPDNYFDAVLCMGVIERVKDDDVALKEIVRVLKHDGTLLITLPNKFNPHFLWRDFIFYPMVSLLRPLYYGLSGKPRPQVIPGHTLYSAGSYANRVALAGCRVTDVAYCGFNFFIPPLDSLFPQMTVSAMKKFEAFRYSIFRHLAGGIIMKGRKE